MNRSAGQVRAARAWIAIGVLALSDGAGAQSSAIEITRTLYVEAQTLPFAPAGAVPAAVSPGRGGAWEVRTSDLRIDRTLERWAQEAGWRLLWDASRHVEIGAPTTFRGSFEMAVRAVLATPGIRFSEFPLEGCLYPNQPPLLRITRQGEQLAECPTEYQE